jgi:hypothetical protein
MAYTPPARNGAGLDLHVDPIQLEPLLRQVVTETVTQLEADRARLNDKLAYSEPEAARLLGLKPHQLRDARLAGKIQCSQITGRRIRYTREDLLHYLATNRWESKAS